MGTKTLSATFIWVLLALSIDRSQGFTFPTIIQCCTDGNSLAKSNLNKNLQLNSAVTTSQAQSDAVVSKTTDVMKTYDKNVMKTYGRYSLAISHGKGMRLYDVDGKEYLDFCAGIATTILGHANPDLKEAVMNQMDRVHHCSNLYYIPEQAKLAEWLVNNSCLDKVFFCNSGAEANEAAIKLARKHAHSKRGIEFPVIITAKNSFHGRTLTAITATGQPKYQKDFSPLTPGFEYCNYNDVADLEALVSQIESRKNEGNGLAAILMEPLQGEGGVVPATKEFFDAIRKICDRTGALMMCDEVQTGMGRTGKIWGYQNLDANPDVITSAKALGGGVPIGAMLCKDTCNVFGPGDHASTYGGNPLACAAGVVVTKALDNPSFLENVRKRGDQFRSLAAELKSKYPDIVTGVRGWGLLSGLQLSESSPIVAAEVTAELMEAGVLVVPAGPKVVRFIPPLIATEQDMSDAMTRLDKALKKISFERKAA